jgi:hypothetical protein
MSGLGGSESKVAIGIGTVVCILLALGITLAISLKRNPSNYYDNDFGDIDLEDGENKQYLPDLRGNSSPHSRQSSGWLGLSNKFISFSNTPRRSWGSSASSSWGLRSSMSFFPQSRNLSSKREEYPKEEGIDEEKEEELNIETTESTATTCTQQQPSDAPLASTAGGLTTEDCDCCDGDNDDEEKNTLGEYDVELSIGQDSMQDDDDSNRSRSNTETKPNVREQEDEE